MAGVEGHGQNIIGYNSIYVGHFWMFSLEVEYS